MVGVESYQVAHRRTAFKCSGYVGVFSETCRGTGHLFRRGVRFGSLAGICSSFEW